MSGFQFPASSSPPSTPDRRSGSGAKNIFGDNNPSTTPAGPPPPSSAGSFTPAGPPPSSFLGSSVFTQNNQTFDFSKQSAFNSPKPLFQNSQAAPSPGGLFGRVSKPPAPSGLSQEFGKRGTSNTVDLTEDDEDAEGEDYDEDENQYQDEEQYSDEDEDQMEQDGEDEYYEGDGLQSPSRFNSSGPLPRQSRSQAFGGGSQNSDLLLQTPARLSMGFSHRENTSDFRQSMEGSKFQRPDEPLFGKFARDWSSRMGVAELVEPDNLILETEDAINRLYSEGIGADQDDSTLGRALATIPGEMIGLWVAREKAVAVPQSEEHVAAIGPGPKATRFATAQFLASLLLRLHHPFITQSADYDPEALGQSLRLRDQEVPRLRHLPSMLLDWMYDNHDPAPGQLNDVRSYRPSPSAHPFFWETVLNSLLRGKMYAVALALRNAGWEHSATSVEDARPGVNQNGYSGQALENVKTVVEEACQILSQCPAIMGDWNIRSSDWTLFRLRVSQSLENLKLFAEGRNKTQGDIRNLGGQSLSATARRAQSQVPWTIYQRLTTLYNIMLGDSLAIMECSQDWCEATVGLVVWWNHAKDDKAFGRSRADYVEESTPEAYFERIAKAFYIATQDSDFQVNTLDRNEVGLASIFEGDVPGAVSLLEACSLPIAAAVVEVACLGGWLPVAESKNLITMDSLDQNDMDVLGLVAPNDKPTDLKDDILEGYASELRGKGPLRYTDSKLTREGWEVAIEVLGRLNSTQRSENAVNQMLEDFPMDSSSMIDKVWSLLNYLGMSSQAETIAGKYADSLADSTKKYGESLWYYALSHNAQKVKDVLDLLVSYSLIHSTAWPPASELDTHLETLINSPSSELAKLSKVDFEAASLLHKMLSGYATLRTFYALRDADVAPTPATSNIQPKARRTQAAAALLAVLASSDDNIRGGLYDEARGAVVSVDFLLALLGESMVFVNQTPAALSFAQLYTLLKAIEDLQGVSERIYNDCEVFLQTVIASTPGLKGSNPMDLLRKSTSGLSGSGSGAGSFSLVGSSMMASQLQRSMSGNSNLAAMSKVDVKRGWDWREGLQAGMKGEDILKILRLGLAHELANAGMREAEQRG